MSEMVKYLEDLEGEFEAEDDWKGKSSGFFCLRCKSSLLTGCIRCSGCNLVFDLPTLPLDYVKRRLKPEMQEGFFAGRTTAEEIAKLQELRRKR